MASPETPADSRAAVPTGLVLVGAVVAILCTGLVFVLGRQQEWTVGGTYLRLFAAALIINLACLLRWNPELI
jgi:hypothetical protein